MERRVRARRESDRLPRLLRLKAEDAEDLAVIAAFLQDAVVLVSDMGHMPREGQFVFVANRFKWEEAAEEPDDGPDDGPDDDGGEGDPDLPDSDDAYERILCGVAFEDVVNVRYRGFDRKKSGSFLELLTIAVGEEPGRGGSTIIELDFADGATVRLEAKRLYCLVEDFGDPWPTRWKPQHR